MNPTEKFVSKLDFFLKLIPPRFVNSDIALDFKTSTIEISIPDSRNIIKIHTERGLIVIEYEGKLKKYNCNFLNSAKQIDDAVNYIAFLSPKDNIPKPKLLVNQFALSFCEHDTGIVLCVETMKRRIGWGDAYMSFDSKKDAIDFAENIFEIKALNAPCIIITMNICRHSLDRKARTANKEFGGMAALRITPDRYNITQRHINLTNKAQL